MYGRRQDAAFDRQFTRCTSLSRSGVNCKCGERVPPYLEWTGYKSKATTMGSGVGHVHVRYMLSPVRLLSVCITLVGGTQPVEMFSNVSSPFGTLATR